MLLFVPLASVLPGRVVVGKLQDKWVVVCVHYGFWLANASFVLVFAAQLMAFVEVSVAADGADDMSLKENHWLLKPQNA